ncbi:MAG: polymer-forming cytoskeletal protein [Thermodesulfobacteriota bacterium]|nr:polymer-forming cytoskeletal protein [Thermodesulfobacteriota bacterium]
MKKGKKKKVDSINTFLGFDTDIEGKIEFRGTIRIDGKVKGKICSNGGTVIVAEKAVVDSEIVVDKAIIMGEIKGSIKANNRIEIYPPGRVIGDIQTNVILIEAGAVFKGKCSMKNRGFSSEKPIDSTKKLNNLKANKN